MFSADPARVVNMPPVIYVPRKLPGIIRCPVDANPPVTSVRWEKDGYPLRIEKVCNGWTSDVWNVKTLDIPDCSPLLLSQYPGWSQMADGSIRVAEVTEDSLGTYTCVPYNVLGTMGQSPPATLVLKVSWCILIKGVIMGGITFFLKVCVCWTSSCDLRTPLTSTWGPGGSTVRRPGESWSSPALLLETLRFQPSYGERYHDPSWHWV